MREINLHCCHINCNKEANYSIVYAPDGIRAAYDRYSHVCKEHIGDLWEDDARLEPLDWTPPFCQCDIEFQDELLDL